MRYLTTYLLVITILLAELHTFWERGIVSVWIGDRLEILRDGKPVPRHNWIIKRYVPLTIQENVKNLTDEVNMILFFVAFIFYSPNRVNKTTVATFLLWMTLDLILYLWNYKTFGYGYVYLILPIAWLLIFKLNKKK